MHDRGGSRIWRGGGGGGGLINIFTIGGASPVTAKGSGEALTVPLVGPRAPPYPLFGFYVYLA